MSNWSMVEDDRDWADEDDYEGFLDDEEFYIDDEDDGINLGGALVPNHPYPKGPTRGDALRLEEKLVLC